jgi:hypothetical protein
LAPFSLRLSAREIEAAANPSPRCAGCDRACRKLYRNINSVRVRGFILHGAPSAYKTTNISVFDLFAGNGGLQHIFAADDPDDLVIDFDRVDDLADGCRRPCIT